MKAFRLLIWMIVLTAGVYPLVVTSFANIFLQERARGSLVYKNGTIIGSRLIGQKFEQEKYFWPRPSAIDYHPMPSGGSNLGPTSLKLKTLVNEREKKFRTIPPSEFLFASGSGVDPHISLAGAEFQVYRIASARSLRRTDIRKLIDQATYWSYLGIFGYPVVNVLELNLLLDELTHD